MYNRERKRVYHFPSSPTLSLNLREHRLARIAFKNRSHLYGSHSPWYVLFYSIWFSSIIFPDIWVDSILHHSTSELCFATRRIHLPGWHAFWRCLQEAGVACFQSRTNRDKTMRALVKLARRLHGNGQPHFNWPHFRSLVRCLVNVPLLPQRQEPQWLERLCINLINEYRGNLSQSFLEVWCWSGMRNGSTRPWTPVQWGEAPLRSSPAQKL